MKTKYQKNPLRNLFLYNHCICNIHFRCRWVYLITSQRNKLSRRNTNVWWHELFGKPSWIDMLFYNTSNLCKKRSFKRVFRRIILKPFFFMPIFRQYKFERKKIIWAEDWAEKRIRYLLRLSNKKEMIWWKWTNRN